MDAHFKYQYFLSSRAPWSAVTPPQGAQCVPPFEDHCPRRLIGTERRSVAVLPESVNPESLPDPWSDVIVSSAEDVHAFDYPKTTCPVYLALAGEAGAPLERILIACMEANGANSRSGANGANGEKEREFSDCRRFCCFFAAGPSAPSRY